MTFLAVAASLRGGSFNRKLIEVAAGMVREAGAEVVVADFGEFVCPYYDADLEAREGVPEGAVRFGDRIAAAEGLLLASPEYNFSLPGTLKNTIDWISRIRPLPVKGKPTLLLGASDGHYGAIRGLWQLRIPLEGCAMPVFPEMYSLPYGKKAFDPEGRLVEAPRRDRLQRLIGAFLGFATALNAARGSG